MTDKQNIKNEALNTTDNTNTSIDGAVDSVTDTATVQECDLPKLIDKHRQFVHDYCYVTGFNAAEAVRKNNAYTTTRPSETACRLLKRTDIAKHIAFHKHQLATRMILDEADILQGFGKFATSDEEKTANRLRALEALAKIKGLMKPDTTVQVANVFSDVDHLRNNIINRHNTETIDATPYND